MRPIFAALKNSNCIKEIELLFASVLKILLRKQVNRDAVGKIGFNAIIQCLSRQSLNSTSAAELGNAVLNACFDSNNVILYLNEGGLTPLLFLLRSSDVLIQASVLGALQGICFTPAGKYSMRSNVEALSAICFLMISNDMSVRARAVGMNAICMFICCIYMYTSKCFCVTPSYW